MSSASRPISAIASRAIRRIRSSNAVMRACRTRSAPEGPPSLLASQPPGKDPWRPGGLVAWRLSNNWLRAELVERARQLRGDVVRVASFDVPALEHLHDLAVFEQRDRGRRRAIADEIFARALCRFAIVAGEDGDHLVRQRVVLECHRHRGTR